jgi:hypothetical protein
MREESRFVGWRGEEFRFEPLGDPSTADGSPPVWAVSRQESSSAPYPRPPGHCGWLGVVGPVLSFSEPAVRSPGTWR